MSQEQCIDGSRMIVQWVKDMADRRGITLDEAHWLPDPAQEGTRRKQRALYLRGRGRPKPGAAELPASGP